MKTTNLDDNKLWKNWPPFSEKPELTKAIEEWQDQGRSAEALHGVLNFFTGRGLQLIREQRAEEARKILEGLPDAVFIDDTRNAVENAAGAGLANYRYAVQMQLIDRIKALTDSNKETKK